MGGRNAAIGSNGWRGLQVRAGFAAFYGRMAEQRSMEAGRLHAVWAAGEPGYRTGTVWANRVDADVNGRR
jgi:hypothetical protein